MRRTTALIAVAVSAACFGTLAIFTSLAYDRGAEPLQLLAWRFGLAAVLLGGYLALTRPRALRVPLADVGRFAVIAVGGYGAASLCFFSALRFADASVVAVLLYTYPAMVAILDWVFGWGPMDGTRFFAVVLAFAGCALVVDPFSGSGGASLAGVVLGLGAAMGYTSFTVLSHRWMPGRSRSVLMTYMFAVNGFAFALIALATGSRLAPTGWGWEVWTLLGAIVLLPTFAAIILYLRALSRIGTAQASLLSTFEPLFTILLAALVLGDRLSPVQAAGAAFVLLGVVIAELRARTAEALPAV